MAEKELDPGGGSDLITVRELELRAAKGEPLEPNDQLRIASAYLRLGRHKDALRWLDVLLATVQSGSRDRLTAVVLRQRVRNLVRQRELLEADGIFFDDPKSPPA